MEALAGILQMTLICIYQDGISRDGARDAYAPQDNCARHEAGRRRPSRRRGRLGVRSRSRPNRRKPGGESRAGAERAHRAWGGGKPPGHPRGRIGREARRGGGPRDVGPRQPVRRPGQRAHPLGRPRHHLRPHGNQRGVRQSHRRRAAGRDLRRADPVRHRPRCGKGVRPDWRHVQCHGLPDPWPGPQPEQPRQQPEHGERHRGAARHAAVRAVVRAGAARQEAGHPRGPARCRPGIHDQPICRPVPESHLRLEQLAQRRSAVKRAVLSAGHARRAGEVHPPRRRQRAGRGVQRRPGRPRPRLFAGARPVRHRIPPARRRVRHCGDPIRSEPNGRRDRTPGHLQARRLLRLAELRRPAPRRPRRVAGRSERHGRPRPQPPRQLRLVCRGGPARLAQAGD